MPYFERIAKGSKEKKGREVSSWEERSDGRLQRALRHLELTCSPIVTRISAHSRAITRGGVIPLGDSIDEGGSKDPLFRAAALFGRSLPYNAASEASNGGGGITAAAYTAVRQGNLAKLWATSKCIPPSVQLTSIRAVSRNYRYRFSSPTPAIFTRQPFYISGISASVRPPPSRINPLSTSPFEIETNIPSPFFDFSNKRMREARFTHETRAKV